jgi:hypothetical protein
MCCLRSLPSRARQVNVVTCGQGKACPLAIRRFAGRGAGRELPDGPTNDGINNPGPAPQGGADR